MISVRLAELVIVTLICFNLYFSAGLSTVVAPYHCPVSGTVADLVVASCMSTIFEATRFTNQSKCL